MSSSSANFADLNIKEFSFRVQFRNTPWPLIISCQLPIAITSHCMYSSFPSRRQIFICSIAQTVQDGYTHSLGIRSPRGYCQKSWLGVYSPLPETFTLFITGAKVRHPFYDRCSWHSYHKLREAFVDGVIDNDEKLASSKKLTQFNTRVLKPYTISDRNCQSRWSSYDPNDWITLPFGAAQFYNIIYPI